MSTTLADYLAALQAALKRGDAREHTHRPAIHRLLEASGCVRATRGLIQQRRGHRSVPLH